MAAKPKGKAKQITRVAKLEFMAGKAKPGPELAGLGLIMPNFTREFNDATRERGEEPVPVTITVYSDKSHSFVVHTSPTAFKIKQAAKITKGSGNTKTTKVATIGVADVRQIALYKLPDLNTDNVAAAMRSVVGTAKQMGVLVEGYMDIAAEKAAAIAAQKADEEGNRREQELREAEAAVREGKDATVEVETTAQTAKDEAGEDAKEGK